MPGGRGRPVVPGTVKGLSFVSLFNDFASEMVYPLLPALVTRVLGGSAVMLGALDGAADLTAAALRWVSGRLADLPRWRDKLILGGYGLAVVIRPVVAVTTAAWQVVGLRVLDRVGKGLRSPARDALIAQVTPVEARGRAFGFHRAADHLGAVAGSLAAWALLSASASERLVIGLSVIPGVVAVGVLVRVLGKADRTDTTDRTDRTDRVDAAGARFWFPVGALALLTVTRLPETLVLLRLQDLGVAVALVPLAWAGLHVVRSTSAYPGGWLSDRLGPRATLGGGGLLFAAVLLLLARPLAPSAAIGVFLVLGVVAGLTEAAERAVVAALAPGRTGWAFGRAQSLAGFAALPAAIGFGALYQALGGPLALVASGFATSGAVLIWMVAMRPRR